MSGHSKWATSKSRDNLANVLPRTLSIAAFLCLIVAHLEWPDMLRIGSGVWREGAF